MIEKRTRLAAEWVRVRVDVCVRRLLNFDVRHKLNSFDVFHLICSSYCFEVCPLPSFNFTTKWVFIILSHISKMPRVSGRKLMREWELVTISNTNGICSARQMDTQRIRRELSWPFHMGMSHFLLLCDAPFFLLLHEITGEHVNGPEAVSPSGKWTRKRNETKYRKMEKCMDVTDLFRSIVL